MRFALVAGALVLGATVTEARSIAPSPSKRTTDNLEFATPSRMNKRARQDSEWNPAGESDDVLPNQDGMDPSTYHSATPSRSRKMNSKDANKTPKHHHKSSAPDAVYRTSLPDTLGGAADPIAGTLEQKLPKEIQYQIIPVPPNNSPAPNSPPSDTRAYIIKPVSPVAAVVAQVDPTDVKQTADGLISSSDLTGMVTHLQTKEDSQPAITLLRAIENYRLALSDVSQDGGIASQSRSVSSSQPAAAKSPSSNGKDADHNATAPVPTFTFNSASNSDNSTSTNTTTPVTSAPEDDESA